jgi:putative ATP-dependent endonuclease of the OLD family
LGRSRASADDLARSAAGTVSTHAVIDLFIKPGSDSFGDHERQRFGGNVHTNRLDATEFAGIRTKLTASREGGQLLAERTFLQPGRSGFVDSPTEFLPSALALFDCELLDASRDLVEELGSKSSRWGRVLFDLQIPNPAPKVVDGVEAPPDPLSRRGLETSLAALATDMRKASPVLASLETDLARLAKVQSSVGTVTLQPFPPQIEEVMRSVDILLGNAGGPRLPLRFHGMGSRSLASLFVFSTLCSLRLGADRSLVPQLVTLVEEPEAHLHPQAISGLRTELESLPGQRIVSTHSAHLISEVHPSNIRVIRRNGSSMRVHRLSTATLEETARFRRFVGRPFGEMFFSRLVIFGDGATERDALPVLLDAALSAPISSLGVTIVDCESMDNPQVPKLIAAANEIGLPWLVFADNDPSGHAALRKILDPDTQLPLDLDSHRVVVAGAKAMERLLLDAGYGDDVVAIAKEHEVEIDGERAQLNYLKSNKGWVGELVARRAIASGKQVPPSITELANRISSVLALSESAWNGGER